MIIRAPKLGDSEQVYEHFRNSQIRKEDIVNRIPKRGFYEYDLKFDDISARVNTQFSLIMLDSMDRLMGYILGYKISFIPELELGTANDPVHRNILGFNKNVVYADQLYLNPIYPIHAAGRLMDAWEYMIRGENVPGVVSVIPENPWLNQSSRRLALARGFSSRGLIKTDKVTLRIFAKPYIVLDASIEGFGDSLINSN